MSEDVIKLDRFYISKIFPKREQDTNKGDFGTVLNFAGSAYYPGAAYLSSMSALRCGTGLVRLASEVSVIDNTASKSSDITFVDLGQNEFGTIPKDGIKYVKTLKQPTAISIGCGLSTLPPVMEFVIKTLKYYAQSTIPVIIDADAINILAASKEKPIPMNSVITPHPKELSRLIRVNIEEIQSDRVKWAKFASSELDCIVVLKGKNTIISVPNGNTFMNFTGNSGLAVGGTGDVLTGMIAGFAAQGVKLEDACVLGVYLHGRAGELASRKLSEYSMLASDLIDFIPSVIREFVI